MKKARIVAVAAAVLGSISACGKTERVLHVYTWADYIKPELVARFEAAERCRVVIDTFDSNEAMFAKMKAGASGYDLVTPSSYMVAIMHQQGMLQDLDRSLLPNAANVDPDYLRIALDPKLSHSVPYMLTITGIGYLKSRVEGFTPSWKAFEREDLKSRMTMLNDMRETIGAALKSLGHSLNTRDELQLQAARDVVIGWRRNLAKLENEQYKTGLASGEFLLVHGYSGDIFQVQAENEDIAFAVPTEGTSVACDDLVIPKGAQQVELAHAFINFLHDPAVAAENTDFIAYLCPNLPSYERISEEMKAFRGLFTGPEVRERSEVIQDLGEDNAKYTKVWDEIKAAE
jgi:spermidine/putrescine transport system substrate-binding protein